MCGIFGCIGRPEEPARIMEAVRRLTHRGPDDVGLERHEFPSGEGWLGFRRLAIQDPTERGHQPMADPTGRWRIVFNGEIYNFRALRKELVQHGHRFRTATDTEVLLAAWVEWERDMLPRLVGMFAFAVLDTVSGAVFLARDRLGIKPLYYLHQHDRLSFASEIKAILALSDVPRDIDEESLVRYLTFLWTPHPGTLFKGVRQLEPGTWMSLAPDGTSDHGRYWRIPVPGTDPPPTDPVGELEDVLRLSVRDRLVSDVPLGGFLSGGVDSSLLVALMLEQQGTPATTHTVVFPPSDDGYRIEEDDAPWARRVRDHFGSRIDYREHRMDPGMVDELPRMVWHLDDPVADPAALATYQICSAAKPTTTVLLAGMGAEELFAGYPRHRAALLAERYRMVPGWVRRGLVEPLVNRLPAAQPGPRMALYRRAQKFVGSAGLDFEDRYLGYAGYYHPDELARIAPGAPVGRAYGRHRSFLAMTRGLDPVDRMTHVDLNTFLPSLNLAYTDRASMAASVEVRVPILDHRVVELAQRIPASWKLRGRTTKFVLKKVAERHLPRAVVHRRKAGFQAPVRAWVSRDMDDRIRDLLAPETIRARGWLDADGVQDLLAAQRSGREDNALRIWALLGLELWARTFLDGDGCEPVVW